MRYKSSKKSAVHCERRRRDAACTSRAIGAPPIVDDRTQWMSLSATINNRLVADTPVGPWSMLAPLSRLFSTTSTAHLGGEACRSTRSIRRREALQACTEGSAPCRLGGGMPRRRRSRRGLVPTSCGRRRASETFKPHVSQMSHLRSSSYQYSYNVG